MLTGPELMFCDGIVAGMKGWEAYAAAFPTGNESRERSYQSATGLLSRPEIKAEIARFRALAAERAGDSVMSIVEKRGFLARVVRAALRQIPEDSDLWQGIKYTKDWTAYELPNKLAALAVDNDLADEGADAELNDHLMQLLASVRQ